MPTPVTILLSEITAALTAGTLVKLTLSKPRRGLPGPDQAQIRPVQLRDQPHITVLLRHANKDITENHPISDAPLVLAELMTRFQNAHVFTTTGDLELRTNKHGDPKLLRHKPTFTAPPSLEHDRPKRYVLDPETAPWLVALGIVGAAGRVHNDKADKYRQLQNILKILDDLTEGSAIRRKPRLRVVDMGCGKGYLTFAIHQYCNQHLGIPTEVIGVDRNAELMALCNDVARKHSVTGLRFECSTVEDYEPGEADILIALHACDTATDVAMFKGVRAGAGIVMVVPCCQKELRPQFKPPLEERALFKHDTFRDRYSQMLTDALRGLLLEARGYRTRVIEFISDAHTHRNVMIVGMRDGEDRDLGGRRAEASAIKARYGIATHTLETLLDSLPTPGSGVPLAT